MTYIILTPAWSPARSNGITTGAVQVDRPC